MTSPRDAINQAREEDARVGRVLKVAGVYFWECAGRVKIGHALRIDVRISDLSCAAPFPAKVIGVIPTSPDDYDERVSLESALHRQLQPLRVHREWFNLTVEEAEAIILSRNGWLVGEVCS